MKRGETGNGKVSPVFRFDGCADFSTLGWVMYARQMGRHTECRIRA